MYKSEKGLIILNKKISNIEKILLRAATNKDFRDKILKDKKSVTENTEFSLSEVDKIFLNNIPPQKLNDMIEHFITQKNSRRNFIKGAAASAAFVISASLVPLSSVLAGGDNNIDPTYGIRPDYPYPEITPAEGIDIPYAQPSSHPIINATPELYKSIITEKIHAQGKTILYKYIGLKVIIPDDSIKESTITIQLIVPSGVNYKNNFIYLGLVQFTPINTKFNKEISIYFPLVKREGLAGYTLNEISYTKIYSKITADENLSKFISNELKAIPDRKFWKSIPAEISEGYVIIKTKKLGIYTVGYFI